MIKDRVSTKGTASLVEEIDSKQAITAQYGWHRVGNTECQGSMGGGGGGRLRKGSWRKLRPQRF